MTTYSSKANLFLLKRICDNIIFVHEELLSIVYAFDDPYTLLLIPPAYSSFIFG